MRQIGRYRWQIRIIHLFVIFEVTLHGHVIKVARVKLP